MLFRGGAGSADCNNPFLRKARGRDHIVCDGTGTTESEIVSQKYLDAFKRMGATYKVSGGELCCVAGRSCRVRRLTAALPPQQVEDPLPESPYTKDIPGGRQIAWGMALNKLKVLGMTDFKRVRRGVHLLWLNACCGARPSHPIATPPFDAGAVV